MFGFPEFEPPLGQGDKGNKQTLENDNVHQVLKSYSGINQPEMPAVFLKVYKYEVILCLIYLTSPK